MGQAHLFMVTHGQKVFSTPGWTPPYIEVIKWPSAAEITIIIPLFERREIDRCIEQLLQALVFARMKANLIVVDQSVGAELRAWAVTTLRSKSAHAHFGAVVYCFDPTLTIATAKNKGVAIAEASGVPLGGLLVFLDSDVYMASGTLASLRKAAERYQHISAFGFPSVWLRHNWETADVHWPSYLQSVPPSLRNKPEQQLFSSGKTSWDGFLLEVPAIHGCLFAIRTEVYRKEGEFHPFFGMHGEYVELCARLRDRGHRLGYVLHPPLFHDDRPAIQYSVTRNLPHREKFLLATLVAMAARNKVYSPEFPEEKFVALVKNKWLRNMNIQPQDIERVHTSILELASLLREKIDDRLAFTLQADVLVREMSPAYIQQYFWETVEHLNLNFDELRSFLQRSSPVQPLYDIV